jgi:hypothetical protein
VVSAFHRYRKVLDASPVAPADIALRDIMTTRENSISDSSQVELDILSPDVDQHDFEPTHQPSFADSAFQRALFRSRSFHLD